MTKSLSLMPAEWFPHQATLISWPFEHPENPTELWQGRLHQVRVEFANLVAAILQSERVVMVLPFKALEQSVLEYLQKVERAYLERLEFLFVPLDDLWLRDTGPIFTIPSSGNSDSKLTAFNFAFNGWGGKFDHERDHFAFQELKLPFNQKMRHLPYFVFEGGAIDVNGSGVGLTTKSCLLTETRNPDMTKEDYEFLLEHNLGIDQLIWLDDGLTHDHTDGHIDLVARFINDATILCCSTDDKNHPSYSVLQNCLAQLREQAIGLDIQIVELPMPSYTETKDEEPLAISYANFYICNDAVLVPIYDVPEDKLALDIIEKYAGNRVVKGLLSKELIRGGGTFHCVTQQVPQI